jgi:hypothetical protein
VVIALYSVILINGAPRDSVHKIGTLNRNE